MHRMLRRYFFASACLSITLSGCFVVVPLIEPDEQAKLSGTYVFQNRPIPFSKTKQRKTTGARLDDLIARLSHREAVVRTHAAFWIGELGPEASRAVPMLISRLHDESNWVRRACAKALGKIGARSALPALRQAIGDKDRFERRDGVRCH